jgi:hypothetical protein
MFNVLNGLRQSKPTENPRLGTLASDIQGLKVGSAIADALACLLLIKGFNKVTNAQTTVGAK